MVAGSPSNEAQPPEMEQQQQTKKCNVNQIAYMCVHCALNGF